MRTLISTVAGLALVAGVLPYSAAANDIRSSQQPQTITVTAGQGGSLTFVVPSVNLQQNPVAELQTVAVTPGQGQTFILAIPAPSIEVAAAKAADKGATGAAMTLAPTEGIN